MNDDNINTNEEYVPIVELDQIEDAQGNPVEALYEDTTNTDDTINNSGEEDSEFQADNSKDALAQGIAGGGEDRSDEE